MNINIVNTADAVKTVYLFRDPQSRMALILLVLSFFTFLYFFIATIRLARTRARQKKELGKVSAEYKKARKRARGETVPEKAEKTTAEKTAEAAKGETT